MSAVELVDRVAVERQLRVALLLLRERRLGEPALERDDPVRGRERLVRRDAEVAELRRDVAAVRLEQLRGPLVVLEVVVAVGKPEAALPDVHEVRVRVREVGGDADAVERADPVALELRGEGPGVRGGPDRVDRRRAAPGSARSPPRRSPPRPCRP